MAGLECHGQLALPRRRSDNGGMSDETLKRPIPPLTTLRLRKLWPHARKKGREIGQVYRVGYYCKHCGRDVIWLVDSNGRYNWTVDHDFVTKFFDVVELSKERSLYGKDRSKLEPIG